MIITTDKPCLYTIPAGLSFVDMLAKGILQRADNDPLSLARMHILLPTRRACRSLREAFLRLTNGKPLLLPRMSPIGDVDEEELFLTLSGAEDDLSLPPAIPSLKRQFLLTRLIQAQGKGSGIEQDMMLANALASLMDQIYTEDLDLKNLPTLVERAEFAAHWQISIDFLSILSEFWPKILTENGEMDSADRRNQLLKKLKQHWSEKPPAYPVIAAGTTGSIPATAALLKTILGLPDGCIVLPGLDQAMDSESWKNLDDTHPQATLRTLLKTLEKSRNDVSLWSGCDQASEAQKNIRLFASEIMRPASTSNEWQSIKKRLSLNADEINIERYDCASPQEEALTIALALRSVLEDKEQTAALVTPDRKLARRVAMACRRWGIDIDDSGGQALTQTKTGVYLRLLMKTACDDLRPVSLLDFCKHTLCLPQDRSEWREEIRSMDKMLLRGPVFGNGIEAYRRKISEREIERIENQKKPSLLEFKNILSWMEDAFSPLTTLTGSDSLQSFDDWCCAHLKIAERFCNAGILWAGQDGESAAQMFSDLREHGKILPAMSRHDYLTVVEQAMSGITVRPAYGLHPRLMILGQLEARLVEADVMVLGGLNEGTWPPAPPADPWMSRPMRKKFGLPPPERGIGLSAHDFSQNICADKVIVTRSTRVDGTPSVPARWLQRMDTVLEALGLSKNDLSLGPYLTLARSIDLADRYEPVERPKPTPPVEVRPRKLSVTKIDTWMRDPYSIYAQYILKLQPLDPLEQPLDAAMKGTMIHAVLDQFVKTFPEELPDNAADKFIQITRKELEAYGVETDVKIFWEPRLEKIAVWLVDTERTWRKDMIPMKCEVRGFMDFHGPAGIFTLSVRADRLDQTRDGTAAAIIDYKSGGTYSQKGIVGGQYPQLPLEALILEQGGFEDTKIIPVERLSYWVVNGSGNGGTLSSLKDAEKLSEAKENARSGLENLIARFDVQSTPYYSLPRPEHAPKFNDYEHLARVREWTALDADEDAA